MNRALNKTFVYTRSQRDLVVLVVCRPRHRVTLRSSIEHAVAATSSSLELLIRLTTAHIDALKILCAYPLSSGHTSKSIRVEKTITVKYRARAWEQILSFPQVGSVFSSDPRQHLHNGIDAFGCSVDIFRRCGVSM